jgi:hypothetical protein
MILLRDFLRRLRHGWIWAGLQFVLTALLILLGIAWTRLPDKQLWQVALTLLLPLLLLVSALELQAGTMRRFAEDDGKRAKLVWGAISMLPWIALGWVAWVFLDWCDDRIPEWAGYLNSRASAHERAMLFNFPHIQRALTVVEWLLRWVAVPAKVVPAMVASAQWGLRRLPLEKTVQVIRNWRWWLAVALAAFLAVWLPGRFFVGVPDGGVSAQIWHLSLKLAGAYLLAVICWVLLLGWAATLFACRQSSEELKGYRDLLARLCMGRLWIGAVFAWILVWTVLDRTLGALPGSVGWQAALPLLPQFLMLPVALIVLGALLRAMADDAGKRVRLVWGALSLLVWIALAMGALAFIEWCHFRAMPYGLALSLAGWALRWVLLPGLLIPFAAASAQWGLRLPRRKVLRVLLSWKWWLGALFAALAATLLDFLLTGKPSGEVPTAAWIVDSKIVAAHLLETAVWILLLGWEAALFGRGWPAPGEAQEPIPAVAGSPDAGKQDDVKLPPPENPD